MSMPALIEMPIARLVVGMYLVDGLVVRDQEALESELALEHVGEELTVARDLHAIPTVV